MLDPKRGAKLMAFARSGQRARGVARIVHGLPATDGGGVRLTRVIGTQQLDSLDPFLLLDELKSDRPGEYLAGFPAHPHRGFETVTYLMAGRMRHRDNQGHSGLVEAGGAAWMNAGRGIIHSEMPEQADGLLWGFQLWVNLPAAAKLVPARWQDAAPQTVPTLELAPGAQLSLLAGSINGLSGPLSGLVTATVLADLKLVPGAQVLLPLSSGLNAFAYVCAGSVEVLGAVRQAVAQQELAVLLDGEVLALAAGGAGARLFVAAASPLGEPIARYGPFVMNTREELMQAVADYQAGRF